MMDIQSVALNELFVLYPVIIPGWVSPVKPADSAHGGIPKSLYDDQPKGLECLVDPWTEVRAWTLAVDDRIDLYINDDPTPVAGKIVDPGEEQLRSRLYVPHGRLRHGVNRLHYTVTRPGGNVEPSRDLNVLYHLRSPGEPAPDGLDLVIPPDVIRDGVSAEWAAQGVEFRFVYSNRRAYDRLRLLLGNATVDWEVLSASGPVAKTLFTDTFQQAGDNPNTLVDFVVFDQLGNFSRSPTKRLDIHLDRIELEKAIFREILSENNDDPALVDLAKLNGGSLWALVYLIDAIWDVGDEIHLTFTALVNGSPVASHEATLPIKQVSGQFSWDIPNAKVIADSIVRISYEQIRGGEVIAASKVAEAQVVGEIANSEDWESETDRTLPTNISIKLKSGLIVTPRGNNIATPAYITSSSLGVYGYRWLVSGSPIAIRFELDFAANFIDFTYGQSHNPQNQIIFFDAQHKVIETQYLTETGILAVCTYKNAGLCTYFDVHVADPGSDHGMAIDKISWSRT